MPGVLITTSHKPSQRTRSFVKDLANTLPFSKHVNRGKKTIDELGLEAYRNKTQYIFVVGEKKGNPSMIRIYKVYFDEKPPKIKHIATLIIRGVKLTRENPDASRAYNPETIAIDYDMCETDNCYKLADQLIEIFHNIISEKPDVTVKLEETRNIIVVKPLNRLGKPCGPIIRVSGVKVYV